MYVSWGMANALYYMEKRLNNIHILLEVEVIVDLLYCFAL